MSKIKDEIRDMLVIQLNSLKSLRIAISNEIIDTEQRGRELNDLFQFINTQIDETNDKIKDLNIII